MNRRTACLIFAVLVGFLLPAAPVRNWIQTPKILIIHSYNPEYKWTENQYKGIMATLETLGREYIVYTEYLDWKRFPNEQHLNLMRKIFTEKYPEKRIDLIIATDDRATQFAMENRKELFSDAPIVFSGVTRFSAERLIGRTQRITGVYEDLPIDSTIRCALKIHPHIDKVYTINERTESGQESERAMAESIAKLIPGRPVVELGDLDIESIEKAVSRMSNNDLLIIGSYSIEKNGRTYPTDVLAERISKAAAVPLYTIFTQVFGSGAIGGTMIDGTLHGNQAGRLAIRYLNGESISGITPVGQPSYVTWFDWNAMKRYKIPASALPKGSMIKNREPTLFEQYRTESYSAVVAFAGLLACVLILLILNRRIRNLAFTDQLTGLPNRTEIYLGADRLLSETERGKQSAIMFIDLDNFKYINDTFGHETGDKILVYVADIIRNNAESGMKVARFGGDEFLVVMKNVAYGEIEDTAKRIHGAITKGTVIDEKEIFLTVSSGIALFPEHGKRFTELFKHADTAMNHAKSQGKTRYKFYDNAMSAELARWMFLENGLHSAIDNGEIYVVYQPQISLATGKLEGLEILVRWKHPTAGMISPAEFIPVAENSGQIGEIGSFVFRSAAKFIRLTQDRGYKNFTISVNVSVRQLTADRYYEEMLAILAEEGVAPNRFALEITESIFMESFERSVELLGKLKAAGFRISLDDFGKGYSSLAYLRKLPITSVKMDKDFIDDILSDGRSRDLARAIIDICHTLSLKVVAEGVETENQTRFLHENNCDYIQGYYFSRPEAMDKIFDMLEMQFYLPGTVRTANINET